MKKIEKNFREELLDLLNNYNLSDSNRYFIKKVIEILNNNCQVDINIINLVDFSVLLDYFDYSNYDRGLLMTKMMVNNFKIIKSQPYSKINIFKYKDIFEKRNISYKQFITDVRNLITSDADEIILDEYRYDILKMFQMEEKNRLNEIKIAKKVKIAYENMNIDEIINYLESIGISEKDVDGGKIYLENLKAKKDSKKESDFSMNLKVTSTKLGYTNKEIKQMDNELTAILNSITEEDRKITYEEYLKYVKYVLVLEAEKKACDADINRLYDALIIDEQIHQFLLDKAQTLLQTNKAIDISDTLQDITDIENILSCCSEEEKHDFKNLLDSVYETLYHLAAYNHVYERTLTNGRNVGIF